MKLVFFFFKSFIIMSLYSQPPANPLSSIPPLLHPSTPYVFFKSVENIVYDSEKTHQTGITCWRLKEELNMYVDTVCDDYWVTVPEGYECTGADVPDFSRSWLSPDSPAGKAAVIHDYLVHDGTVSVMGMPTYVNRREANRIFLQAMQVAGVGFFKRWALFLLCTFSHSSLKMGSGLSQFNQEVITDF